MAAAARSFNPDTEEEQQTENEEGQESVDRDEMDSPSEPEEEEHHPRRRNEPFQSNVNGQRLIAGTTLTVRRKKFWDTFAATSTN